MAFLTGKIELLVYTDEAQTEFPMEKIPNISKEFEGLDIDGVMPFVTSLAASGTQTLNFNGLSVKKIYIHSNLQNISVNINGLGAITYEAEIPGFMPLAVSSLVITNLSSTDPTTVTVIAITD